MVYIYALGTGGAGGNGAVGAVSTAAGGGGGASGTSSRIFVPALLVPSTLFCEVGYAGGTADTKVSVTPRFSVASEILLHAPRCATTGGDASGATPGSAGSAPAGGSAVGAPLSVCCGFVDFSPGQAGIAGSAAGTPADVVPNTTFQTPITGGGGGGGLPGAGVVGNSGSKVNFSAAAFMQLAGGLGAASATTPGGAGSDGMQLITGLYQFCGGTGGGSSHGSATGAGLVGGNGGNGAPGCGGGGGGGALTGSTQGLGGRGGPGLVIIIAW